MNPMAQQKIQGMENAMAARQDKDLFQAKQKYEMMIAANRNTPDEGLLSNLTYHLNMIKSELGRRFPKKKNNGVSNASGNIPKPKSGAGKMKETSLDDLKIYLENTQNQIASDKLSQDQKAVKEVTAKAIENEINERDTVNSNATGTGTAVKVTAPSSSKKNIALGIVVGAGLGSLVGWKMGKAIWMFAVGGAALGTGAALWFNKKEKSALVPKTTTGK